MALKKQFGCPVSCMVPRGSSCHGCPLWALSVCKYILWGNTDSVGGSKHEAVHGRLIISSPRLNPVDESGPRLCLMDDGESPADGPRRQLSSNTHTHTLSDIPGVAGQVQKTLAPGLSSASKETKGKPGPSLCLGFFISSGFGQTISLVTSQIPFPSASRILDPLVPRQTLTPYYQGVHLHAAEMKGSPTTDVHIHEQKCW